MQKTLLAVSTAGLLLGYSPFAFAQSQGYDPNQNYNQGQSYGEDYSHDQGYNSSSGQNYGSQGYNQNQGSGYNRGYSQGYSQGYDQGYRQGFTQAPSSGQGQSSLGQLPQQLRQKLQNQGFTNVQIVPGSFIVSARDQSGDPVMMVIGPHSTTMIMAGSQQGSGSSGGQGSSGGSSSGNQ